MTLDEAIADVARGSIVAGDTLVSWRARMLQSVQLVRGYSWGIIAGAYGERRLRIRTRSYSEGREFILEERTGGPE
jgi:hypothetical protein